MKSGKTLVLLAVSIATFFVPLNITTVAIALNNISQELGASYTELQWVIHGYTLISSALLLVAGTIVDRYGRKRVLLISLFSFAITSFLCGLSDSSSFLIICRLFQGAAGSFLSVGAVANLAVIFTGPERAKAYAVWGMFVGLGMALGPLIGGIVVEYMDWPYIFFMNTPISIVVAALIAIFVKESFGSKEGKLDISGIVLSIMFLFSLFYTFAELGDSFSFRSVILPFFITSVAFWTLIKVEKNKKNAVLDLKVFKSKFYLGVFLLGILNGSSYYSVLIYISMYLGIKYQTSTLETGLAILPMTLPILLLAPLGAKLTVKLRADIFLGGGMLFVALGFFWLSIAIHSYGSIDFILALAVAGIGAGVINAEISGIAIASVPRERAGMAAGLISAARNGGFALGTVLIGFVMAYDIKDLMLEKGLSGMAAYAGQIVIGQWPDGLERHEIIDILGQAMTSGIIFGALMALLAVISIFWCVGLDKNKSYASDFIDPCNE